MALSKNLFIYIPIKHSLCILSIIAIQINLVYNQQLTRTNVTSSTLPSLSTTTSHTSPLTSFYYPDPTSTSSLPNNNDTVHIVTTLLFESIINDTNYTYIEYDEFYEMLIIEFTEIYILLLNHTLNEYNSNYNNMIYLQHIPSNNNNKTLIINHDLYETWVIYILNDTNDINEVLNILISYISSSKFIEEFNEMNDNNNITYTLIELYDIYINNYISTTYGFDSSDSTDTDTDNEMEYILPEHLRDFMIVYVILFSITSITLLCFGCYSCNDKWIESDSDNDNNENKYDDQFDKIETIPFTNKNTTVSRTSIHSVDSNTNYGGLSVNNVYSSTAKLTNKKEWEQIDKNEAEYVMTALDDDAGNVADAYNINYNDNDNDSDNNFEEIQMMKISTQSINPINLNDSDNEMTNLNITIQDAYDEA